MSAFDAAQRASRYRNGVRDRPVAPPPEAIAGLDCLKGEMPDRKTAADAVLEMLDDFGSPTVANAGGRYFGFANGAPRRRPWLRLSWLRLGTRTRRLRVMSPTATVLEDTALRWIRDLLRLQPACR